MSSTEDKTTAEVEVKEAARPAPVEVSFKEPEGAADAASVMPLVEARGDVDKLILDAAVKEVKERLGDTGIKKSTLGVLIRYTMEAVEKTPVKGAAQKDFAVRLIGDLMRELPDGEEKAFLLDAVDAGTVGDTIDLVVAASRGELNVNAAAEVVKKGCFKAIFACLLRQK